MQNIPKDKIIIVGSPTMGVQILDYIPQDMSIRVAIHPLGDLKLNPELEKDTFQKNAYKLEMMDATFKTKVRKKGSNITPKKKKRKK